ncbi:MAG: sugar phosphate isomerase/epimerase [Phycisphaeraceae bacterium]|nr:sugar phosphate isomerase/epimerase [Phycisphaeraceae bacterium]
MNKQETTTRWPLGVTAVMLSSLDFDQQIALCRELGVTHYVYRPRIIADDQRDKPFSNWGNHKFDLTPARLLKQGAQLTQRLRQAGLQPFGTVPNATADDDSQAIQLHMAGAAAAGCTRVRVAPPRYPQGLFDYGEYLARTIECFKQVVAVARPMGIKPVIEMHANSAATSPGLSRLIVQSFDPAELGLILDLPNAAIEGYVSPDLAVSAVADWIDHLHVGGAKRTDGERDEHGYLRGGREFCALVDNPIGVPAWLNVLAQLDRPIPLIIEDYRGGGGKDDAERLRQSVEQLRRLL